jgi:hypothetical protein
MSPQPQYVEVAEIAVGVFAASALYGIYKRHNCGVYLEEHPPPVVCTGGMRNVGNRCYCAAGQSWNGLTCQGTPDPGACAGGAYPFGPPNAITCFCLDGFRLDSNQCIQLQCTGGAFAQVDQCVCPNGHQWDGAQCVAPPEPQDDGEQGTDAACPEGSVVGGPFGDQCMSCPGGGIPTGLYNRDCACPDGTIWNGSECAAPQPDAPPAQRAAPPRVQSIHRRAPNPQAQGGASPPPPVYHSPPPNPAYHASYQRNIQEPQNQCRAFTSEPATNMGACSSFCTGLLQKRLRCQCAPGGC